MIWLLPLLFVAAMPGSAQELAATLSGTVTDTSGALVPNAAITITLNGVNSTGRLVQSDASGSYTATNLPAGTYSVKTVAQGFETYDGKNIVLNVAEKHTFNIQLKAGALTTTVTVEDNPVSIDTESSAQAGTISGTQVRELELSNRNFEQLVTLQPGVVNQLGDEVGFGLSDGTALAVNGARETANNWTVDGADINDSGSNATLTNVPSVDAIQEFTLQRGTYDAGYGRSGGGQVLVATKSGNSAFHGDVYEFVRNDALNANSYFNNLTGQSRTIERYNNFGYTIGGPVFIPKVYNIDKKKTFFFWSEEWRKTSTPDPITVTPPSAAQLSGAIAGKFTPSGPNGLAGCTTYDAATDTTQINSGCYSANAQVYLTNVFSKFPPNNGDLFYQSYSQFNNFRQDIVRVDHYFSDKLHFYARGMQDDTPIAYPTGLWAGNNYPGTMATSVDAPGKNVVGNLTWTISPKVVNEVEFVWAQGSIAATLDNGDVANSSSVRSALTNNWNYADPYGRIPSVSFLAGGIQGFGEGSAPYKERNLDRTYFDNVSISLGRNTIRAGFQIQQMLKTENASSGAASFVFPTWGDFLLGNAYSYSQASHDSIPDLHYINSEAYVQDDLKVTKKFTLNLGVRWSRFPSPTDVNNTLNNFDPLLYSAVNAPAIDPLSGEFAPGQVLNGNALVPSTYSNGLIFPKGAACSAAQAIGPLVQCSPYGAYVNPNHNNNFGPRIGFAYSPDGRGLTSIRGGFGIFYDRVLNGIWEQNAFGDPPLVQTATIRNTSFDSPAGANVVAYGPNLLTTSGNPEFQVPKYANYNLSFQRQLLPTTFVEVAYVGNQARHLLGELDLNQPTLGDRTTAGANVDVNAIRPYLGYGPFHTRAPLYTNNYNSLQVSLNHRSSRGLTVGIAYTWSKDLTTNSNDRGTASQNTYSLLTDYGPSASNTPQVFEANYVWDLPFYKTQQGLVGHLLGGWELSGITSMVSGSSFQATQPGDPFACTADATTGLCAAGTGANMGLNGIGLAENGDIAIRPDQLAGVHKTKSRDQWFSTSSFGAAVGHFGSEGSNPLLGPGMQRWDLASIKNINLGDRLRFQLRGEYFNAFNHTSWDAVDDNISDSNFGQVTSAHIPREVQIGGKIIF
ncbi:MAG TPA: carboxypeptidase regulatory-like domain-containing protein [Terracidiphilus sp.]|nr:carboxypeptidase regulatory-like domain-containing protein [Terracidiphilus sp.]